MRRVNILGVEISAVNKETAIQYLLENMDKARGKYICACNVHTTVTAHENLDYQAVQNNSFMTLPDGKPLSSVGVRRGYSEMGRVTGPDFMEQVIAATEKSDARHYFYTALFWKPNLVHVHSSFGGSFYRKALIIEIASLSKIPVVNHVHGADFDEFYRKKSQKKKKTIEKIYNKCINQRKTTMIGHSTGRRITMKPLFPEKFLMQPIICGHPAIIQRKTDPCPC